MNLYRRIVNFGGPDHNPSLHLAKQLGDIVTPFTSSVELLAINVEIATLENTADIYKIIRGDGRYFWARRTTTYIAANSFPMDAEALSITRIHRNVEIAQHKPSYY